MSRTFSGLFRAADQRRCPSLLLVSAVALGGLISSLPAASTAADAPAAEAPAVLGIGPYDPTANYPAGGIAIGADGNTYRAAREVTGIDPTQATAESWRLALASNEVLLDVPDRFKSIAEAMDFVAGCRIAETAKVVVLIAPGTLEHDEPLVLNHAEGARIVIRGAGEDPEDCVLEFSDDDPDERDGLVIENGHVIVIENLTIASATKKGRGIGMWVDKRSSAKLIECRLVDFTCVVDANSDLTAEQCRLELNRAGDGVHVRNSSEAVLVGCHLVSKFDDTDSHGCHAYNGATLFCYDCRVEGWNNGFRAYNNGVMHVERCVARDNVIGASVWFSSSMNLVDSVFAKNEKVGVAALFATASVIDCQLTANGAGAWTIGNAYLQFLEKPSRISGSPIGVEAKAGGRADLIGGVVFKDVATQLSVGTRPCDLPIEAAFINAK
jgi:hypothetical protein